MHLFSRFRTWRGALKLLSFLSWVLAIPTLGVSISLWIHGGFTDESVTTVTIRSGPCESINSLDTWIHLVMNILSSSLLAATVSSPIHFVHTYHKVSANPLTGIATMPQ